eukprot:1028000-Pleurochrysis_carterae.AAC.1
METMRSSHAFREAVALIRAAALKDNGDSEGAAAPVPMGVQPRWRTVGEEVYIPAQVKDVQEHMQQA